MSENTVGATNALTRVTTRENGDGFCRTALQLTEDVTSVDVLFPDGRLLCRLNIVCDEDSNWGSVHVVLHLEDTPEEERNIGTVKALREGLPVLDECLPQCSRITIDISGPDLKEGSG